MCLGREVAIKWPCALISWTRMPGSVLIKWTQKCWNSSRRQTTDFIKICRACKAGCLMTLLGPWLIRLTGNKISPWRSIILWGRMRLLKRKIYKEIIISFSRQISKVTWLSPTPLDKIRPRLSFQPKTERFTIFTTPKAFRRRRNWVLTVTQFRERNRKKRARTWMSTNWLICLHLNWEIMPSKPTTITTVS